MNNQIYLLIMIFIFTSCEWDNPKIKIINNSGELITSLEYGVKIGNLDQVDTLHSGDELVSKIVFSEDVKGDGAYILKFEKNGESHNKSFGYYTNGSTLDRKIIVDIKPDTIIYTYK